MTKKIAEGNTILSLLMADSDRLLKDMFSRGPNIMHIITTRDYGVLLEPIKNVVPRKAER